MKKVTNTQSIIIIDDEIIDDDIIIEEISCHQGSAKVTDHTCDDTVSNVINI